MGLRGRTLISRGWPLRALGGTLTTLAVILKTWPGSLKIASLAPRNNYDFYYIFCIYLISIILINNRKPVFLECNRRKHIIFSLHLFDHKRISCIFRILRIFRNAYIDDKIKISAQTIFRTIFGHFLNICCTISGNIILVLIR